MTDFVSASVAKDRVQVRVRPSAAVRAGARIVVGVAVAASRAAFLAGLAGLGGLDAAGASARAAASDAEAAGLLAAAAARGLRDAVVGADSNARAAALDVFVLRGEIQIVAATAATGPAVVDCAKAVAKQLAWHRLYPAFSQAARAANFAVTRAQFDAVVAAFAAAPVDVVVVGRLRRLKDAEIEKILAAFVAARAAASAAVTAQPAALRPAPAAEGLRAGGLAGFLLFRYLAKRAKSGLGLDSGVIVGAVPAAAADAVRAWAAAKLKKLGGSRDDAAGAVRYVAAAAGLVPTAQLADEKAGVDADAVVALLDAKK